MFTGIKKAKQLLSILTICFQALISSSNIIFFQ